MGRICDSCGKQISNEIASFCPYCGAAIKKSEWKCEKCSIINDNDAKFCKNCGSPKEREEVRYIATDNSIDGLTKHKYFKQTVVGAVLLLATGFGSYYYFNNMNEGNYLNMYAEAHRVQMTFYDSNGRSTGSYTPFYYRLGGSNTKKFWRSASCFSSVT